MKIHNVEQGTPEWKRLRAEYLTASNAPAMMGESRFKSRNQLIHEVATGEIPEVSPAQQRNFDRGHEAEEAARAVLQMETLDEYPPMVASVEVDGLPLLASFDGFCQERGELWEHKLWNEDLARAVRAESLPAEYYYQLEHQLLVAEGHADRVTFVVSDGTMEKRCPMTYYSVPERRARLVAGWKRFVEDVKNYKPKAKIEQAQGEDADGFPLVKYEIKGTAICSNLQDILPLVKERAKAEMERPLETDQDFANKEQQVKAVKAARKHLKETLEEAKSEFVSFNEFSTLAGEMDSVLQKLQSHGEKAVKEAKAVKRSEIETDASGDWYAYLTEWSAQLGIDAGSINLNKPDFAGAMKNKKTLESVRNAVDEELNRAKIDADQVLEKVSKNMAWFDTIQDSHKFLFKDLERIVTQDGFTAIVKQRISEYEEQQERERQRKEKAQQEADEAASKREEREREIEQEREQLQMDFEAAATNETERKQEQPTTEERHATPDIYDAIAAWGDKHKINPDAMRELFGIISKREEAA